MHMGEILAEGAAGSALSFGYSSATTLRNSFKFGMYNPSPWGNVLYIMQRNFDQSEKSHDQKRVRNIGSIACLALLLVIVAVELAEEQLLSYFSSCLNC